MSTLYGRVAWHVLDTVVCVATSNIFLPPTTISFTTTTATPPMLPKPQSKAPTKATADSRKWQALNADQQSVKRSHCGTKPNNNNRNNNNNNDLNPKDADAANVEDRVTKARGRGGKKATGGQGKRGPATAKYVAHMIDGHRAIDRVLSPPHFKPTDLPPQENHPGLQSRRHGSQNPTQV